LIFQLSEANERVIRTYECTRFKRWFRPPTVGYLTITNRRVVFHSSGKSLTGQSLLISEMPVEDVSGLNVYQGSSLRWLGFLLYAPLAYLITEFVGRVLPPFFRSYGLIALLILPAAAIWLLGGDILSESVREQILGSIENASGGRIKVTRDLKRYQAATMAPLYIGLVLLIWRLGFTTRILGRSPFVTWFLLLVLYGYIYLRLSGRARTFSLLVGSRTMKGTGIFIPGDTFRLLASRDMAAVQALGASPAKDVGQVARELGALLLDIQQLGDLGIQKWEQPGAPATAQG